MHRSLAIVVLVLTLSGRPFAEEPAASTEPAVARRPLDVAWLPQVFADYLATGQTPRPSVARIVAPDGGGTSVGSGVLVDINASQGLVLTNWHVVREAKGPVLVQFPDGFQSAGTVLRQDPDWDLAVLVIWKPDCEPVAIAARSPAIGEQLTIAGYGRGPYREQTGPCTQYLSPGSGLPLELVELVATARQGDSGGPIFNASGELAGVLFGQGDGRTVGSCASRVRMFLQTVGSSGFDQSKFQLASTLRTTAKPSSSSVPSSPAPTAAILPNTLPVFVPGQAAAGQAVANNPVRGLPDGMVAGSAHGPPAPAVDPIQRIMALARHSPDEAARLGLSALGAGALSLLALRALFGGGKPAATRVASRGSARSAPRSTPRTAPRWRYQDDDDDDDEDDDDDDDDD